MGRGEGEPTGRFAIAELTGGLGNQLFQYAAARALCLREGRQLFVAFHLNRGDTHRRFMLGAFRLFLSPGAPLLDESVMRALRLWFPKWRAKLRRLWPLPEGQVQVLNETSFAYAPLAGRADGLSLRGYFQSWRHFTGAEAAVRDELSLAHAATGRNAELLARMASENAVCLHVRRGDYAHDATTNAYHGLMGVPYYQAGIEALGGAKDGATYYVFSDDPAWTKAHVHPPGPAVFVDHNGPDTPWEDLRLMAACRSFVIANSSLSWWGAWLSAAAEKRVVAPRRWFAAGAHDTKDLCPPDWVRL